MTFESIYDRVNEVGGEMAFTKNEARALYDVLNNFDNAKVVVELGVEYGRSTTVFAEMALIKGYKHYAVDLFGQENGPDCRRTVQDRATLYGWKNTEIIEQDTSKYTVPVRWISALFVDAGHEYDEVSTDLVNWLKKVPKGAPVMFHDYKRESLPGVTEAVQDFVNAGEIKEVLHVDTFAHFERL